MPTILLVEDHEGIADILTYQLQRAGFSLIAVNTLATAKHLTLYADIIILDWLLPDGEGTDLLAHTKNIPVIMLTAKASDIHKQKALKAGVNLFLSKPFVFAELLNAVKKLINPTR